MEAEKTRIISYLARGLLHELNNLFSGILGYTELAMADSSYTSEMAEVVFKESKRAIGIIQKIQNFAKEHSPKEIALDEFFSEIEELIRRDLIKARVYIHKSLEENKVIVKDRARFELAITSLILAWLEQGLKGKITIASKDEKNKLKLCIEMSAEKNMERNHIVKLGSAIAQMEEILTNAYPLRTEPMFNGILLEMTLEKAQTEHFKL